MIIRHQHRMKTWMKRCSTLFMHLWLAINSIKLNCGSRIAREQFHPWLGVFQRCQITACYKHLSMYWINTTTGIYRKDLPPTNAFQAKRIRVQSFREKNVRLVSTHDRSRTSRDTCRPFLTSTFQCTRLLCGLNTMIFQKFWNCRRFSTHWTTKVAERSAVCEGGSNVSVPN